MNERPRRWRSGGTFLNWPRDVDRWPGTELLKPEYMTPPMFGWALAHLVWFGGEENPAWSKYLQSAARSNLKQGLRYLNDRRLGVPTGSLRK